jgi:hypothetical protein
MYISKTTVATILIGDCVGQMVLQTLDAMCLTALMALA